MGEHNPEEQKLEEQKPAENGLFHELKIGTVQLTNNLVLAPMAGVTDLPFRLLCHEQGAGLVSMEMISAKAIYYKNKNTEGLLEIREEERPTALQLFGSDPEILAQMAAQIEERPFDILDFNMGCPVPKVVNNHEGSALMKDPKLAERILTGLVKAVRKPVTVKIRRGFDEEHVNAVEIAKIAEACGVAAITVHGRTREQYYAGKADLEIIARVKQAVKIPVIGNGDVTGGESARNMLEQTGCDGIMIGRGVRGNPWIFREIRHFLLTGEKLPGPSREEVRDTILRHGAMELACKGEYTAIREMRKHIAWYTAGYPNSAAFRRNVNEMENFEDLKGAVEEIFAEDSKETMR